MAIYGQTTQSDKPRHPSAQWAKWKSSQKAFLSYDKEKGENVKVKLPKEFVVVAEGWSVDGYVKAFNGGVRSNEILSFSDPIVVKKPDGSVYAKGVWKDIKEKVKILNVGLVKNLHYCDGIDMKTLVFGSAGVKAWMEAVEAKKINPATHKIKFTGEVEGKNGAVVFNYPSFENGSPLTEEDKKLQQAFGMKFLEYRSSIAEDIAEEANKEEDLSKDVPF